MALAATDTDVIKEHSLQERTLGQGGYVHQNDSVATALTLCRRQRIPQTTQIPQGWVGRTRTSN